MENKKCSVCGLEKPKTEKYFAKASPSAPTKDGFKGRCRDCANKKKKDWRKDYEEKHGEPESRRYTQSHREDYAKLNAIRVQKNKEIVDKIKEETSCADCNNKFPAVCMDFDHINEDKVAGVCWMINQGRSLEKIMEEIAKCELVCANCHRIRTHASGRERPWYDARRKYDRSSWNAQGM